MATTVAAPVRVAIHGEPDAHALIPVARHATKAPSTAADEVLTILRDALSRISVKSTHHSTSSAAKRLGAGYT